MQDSASSRQNQSQFFLRALKNTRRPWFIFWVILALWAIVFINIMHIYFQESSGASFLAPLFNWQPLAIALRILAGLGLIYILISLSRSLGAAETAQPFQRFARHLEKMGLGDRSHFHPRAGDTHIRMLSDPFNIAIDRINQRAQARIELVDQMQTALQSSESAATRLKKIKALHLELQKFL